MPYQNVALFSITDTGTSLWTLASTTSAAIFWFRNDCVGDSRYTFRTVTLPKDPMRFFSAHVGTGEHTTSIKNPSGHATNVLLGKGNAAVFAGRPFAARNRRPKQGASKRVKEKSEQESEKVSSEYVKVKTIFSLAHVPDHAYFIERPSLDEGRNKKN